MQPETALLEELDPFLRIPSISASAEHAADVRRAAEWVYEFLSAAGAECQLRDTATGLPLLDARLTASIDPETAPDVLVYGHVDVQPAGERSLWQSDPFVPEIRDGYLYGRGAVDDKGNLYLLLRAVADLAASGRLPVNLRVLCDGEEEIGGSSVAELLESENIRADACVIFDSMMPRLDSPSFEIGTRGLAYFKVAVVTGDRDLHSGLFGGGALNAAHVLTDMLRAVVAVPDELRAGVIPPSEGELASWAELDTGPSMLDQDGGRPRPDVDPDGLYEAIVANPAVDVNGISTGEADLVKTVLPVHAHANVSMRLAPGQNTDEMVSAFEGVLRGAGRRRRFDYVREREPRLAGRPRSAGDWTRASGLCRGLRTPAALDTIWRNDPDHAGTVGPRHPDRPERLRLARSQHALTERAHARSLSTAWRGSCCADVRAVRRTRARLDGINHLGRLGGLERGLGVRVLGVRHQPRVAECAHRCDNRQQSLALLGQRVLDPGGRLGKALAREHGEPLECVESLRERSRADSRAGPFELREAARTLGEVVHDQRGPLGADDLGGAGDRAVSIVNRPHRAHRHMLTRRPSPLRGAGSVPRRCAMHPAAAEHRGVHL